MFKLNEILVCSWGYDQTNVDFYQVTKVTEKFVTLRQISSQTLKVDKHGTSKQVAPILNSFIDTPFRRKVIINFDEPLVRINSYSHARRYKRVMTATSYA